MSLARDLVQLELQLRELDEAQLDLFARGADARLGRIPEAAALADRISRATAHDRLAVTRLALQALRVQHADLSPRLLDASLVATFPGEVPLGAAFPTQQVIRDMLGEPKNEIIALGYEFSHGEVLSLLHDQARRGARVVLICDRERVAIDKLKSEWPLDCLPQIYCDQPRPGAAPYAKMHCKTILVDETDLLITSANFTFHGLEGNIEFGVRLRGGPAGDAKDVFSRLIRSGLVAKV